MLRDVEGLSAREVARVVGVSVEAVKSRLHRARVAIREELAPALGHTGNCPTARSAVPGCPDALLAASRRRDRSGRVRDDGGASRAMPSVPRRLRVAEAHAGDLPAVADTGRARIPGRVRQSRHPRIPQPTLTSPNARDCAGMGDFSRLCGLRPARTSSFWRNPGDLRSGAAGAPVAQPVSGRREPFQARLAPTGQGTPGQPAKAHLSAVARRTSCSFDRLPTQSWHSSPT